MEKHFELTQEFKINFLGIKLFRIKATRKSKYANTKDLGGWVEKDANLSGDAWVYGDAEVYGNAMVYGDAEVYGNARVYGNAVVYGNARVYGDARVYGNAWVSGNAETKSNDDYCYFQNFGSQNRTTTFFKEKKNKIKVNCGCFSGSIEEFEKQVKETHGEGKNAKEYLSIIEVVKIKFEL